MIRVDFRMVFEKVVQGFHDLKIRYALIGGFALGLWGVPRATVDLDFLIAKEDIPKVDKILKNLGYECRYRSENVSQYVSPLRVFGNIDCLHAFRIASLNMIERAEDKEIFGGATKIKVACPEDLIGLKLQAMRNDSSRREQDFADIKALVSLWSSRLDWSLIEEYARILEMEEVYQSFAPPRGNEGRTTESDSFS